MARRLDHQLVLLLGALLAGGIAVHASHALEERSAALAQIVERQALSLAGSIARSATVVEPDGDESLRALLVLAEHFDGVAAAAITDRQGHGLAAVRRDASGRMRADVIETPDPPPQGSRAMLVRRHGGASEPLVAWSPIEAGGWVRLEVSRRSEHSLQRQAGQESLALGTAIVLLAMAALLTYLRRPLAQIREAAVFARSLDTGARKPLSTPPSSREMADLAVALDQAARSLRSTRTAAAQSEERYREVLANLSELVFQTDAIGRWTYLSAAWERITGYTVADTLGRSALAFMPTEDRKKCLSRFRSLSGSGAESLRATLRYRARDGSLRWAETSVRALRDDAGRCRGYAGTAADVTERHLARERLQDQLHLMQQLIEVIPTPVYIKDSKGRYRGFNKAFATFFGKRRRNFLGRNVFDLFPPALARWHDERDRALTAQGGTQTFEAQVIDAAGMLRDTIYHKARFSRSNGKVAGIVGVITDISERKAFERELIAAKAAAEAASRAKSAFLANMSHEIRTPMNAIIGMTDLTLDSRLDAEQRAHLMLVKQAADALLTIINDVFDFSRADSGGLEYERIPFSLRDCVMLATRATEARARDRGLELHTMIPESVPDVVSGDPYRLRQILLKLLGNAVKFTERGSVTIAVELEAPAEAPHRLRFAVSDTGIGIPPEHQSQIFNAFAQADTSATRRHGGAGLGLAICARLVQGMGGQIALESSPGAGSTFRFSLPLYANAAPETTADAPGHHLRGLRALVVGTAQAGGQPLETLLQAWGMASRSMSSVAEAGTALDAARAEGQPVDLVVLGSQAAGEDGCATAELLRKHAGATHIVVVTAAGLRGDAARCRKLGVSAYLTQPVSNRDLLEALQLVMRRNRKSQAQELVTRHSLRERRRHLTLLLAGGDPAGRKFALRLLRKLGHHATLAFDGRDAVEHARREVFDAILIDLDTPDGGGIDVARQIRTLDPGRPTPARVIALTARSVAGDRSEYHAASIDAFISKPLEMFRLAQVLDGIEHPSGTAPAFDRRAVLDNLGGDTELLQALATTFLDTHGDSLEKLRAAVRGGDWEGSYRAAHALKGAAGNFSATAVIDAALAVERSARKGDAAETRAAARDLESRIDALADALREEFDTAPLAA